MNTADIHFQFDSIILVTRDPERSEKFYKQALGMHTVARIRDKDNNLITVQLEREKLKILLSLADPHHQTDTPVHAGISSASVVFNVDDVDKITDDFVRAGGILKSGPKQRYWGARTALLEDIDGHRWLFQTLLGKTTVTEIQNMLAPWTYESLE